jgi:O-antigen/teichoic acid export membrane protein
MKIFDFVLARLPAPIRERAKSGTLGHRLAKSTFWSLAGSVIGRLVGIPTGVLLARLLGRHDYGELGMIYSSIELFGIFGGFGLGITATKHVAEFKRRDPERAGILAFPTSRRISLVEFSL